MGFEIRGLDPMGYVIKTITSAKTAAEKAITKASIKDYAFISNLLEQCNIPKSDSNCAASLNKCLTALIRCYDYLKSQHSASSEQRSFKRSYVKDCMQITQCCNTINDTLWIETVVSNALLWQLIDILKESSGIIKSSTDKTTYTIADKDSDEDKNSSKEKRHDKPMALLLAALFVGYSGSETYLTKKGNVSLF